MAIALTVIAKKKAQDAGAGPESLAPERAKDLSGQASAQEFLDGVNEKNPEVVLAALKAIIHGCLDEYNNEEGGEGE